MLIEIDVEQNSRDWTARVWLDGVCKIARCATNEYDARRDALAALKEHTFQQWGMVRD